MSNLQSSADKAQMIELLNSIKLPIMGAGGGFAPIGKLGFYDGTVAPQGWLACDGTVYNISDYPELAAHYASHHGASNFYGGNGTTTFAVPDLRGEFLRGAGTNSHENQGSGANVGVHQDATANPSYRWDNNRFYMPTGYFGSYFSDADYGQRNVDSQIRNNNSGSDSGYNSVGEGMVNGSFEPRNEKYETYTSRPTNTSFLICVKATVAGDPNAHVYSTDEQVVGMDENGNYIYEKMIKTTTPSSASVDAPYSLGVSVDRYFGFNVIVKRNNGRTYINNGAILGDFSTNLSVALCDNTDSEYPNSIVLVARNNSLLSRPCTMIVQYTKTQS